DSSHIVQIAAEPIGSGDVDAVYVEGNPGVSQGIEREVTDPSNVDLRAGTTDADLNTRGEFADINHADDARFAHRVGTDHLNRQRRFLHTLLSPLRSHDNFLKTTRVRRSLRNCLS